MLPNPTPESIYTHKQPGSSMKLEKHKPIESALPPVLKELSRMNTLIPPQTTMPLLNSKAVDEMVPTKRPNGKQMIKMDEPVRMKELKKTAATSTQTTQGGEKPMKIAGVHFCKRHRTNVGIDCNQKLTVQICDRCKVCSF